MDIVDDIVALLRVVLDYIGIDVEDVQGILEEINARRRLRFYQTRQAISYNWRCFVVRRQSVRDKVKRIRSDVRHQSLMRIIGSYLPGKPAKRMRIQNHLLECRRTKFMYDSDSDDSVITTTTLGSTSDDDIVWVEEEIGDNCVRVRAEKRRNFEDCDAFDELGEDLFIARNPLSCLSPMSSTMISSDSSIFHNPAEQTQKLTAMEDELNNLRQQIAMLVEAQEQTNKSQIPQQSFQEQIVSVKETSVVTSLSPPVAPPPPPPPPPPQIPTTKQRQIISPILTDRQDTLQTENSDKNTAITKSQLTLTDVLKGLGNVKLKNVSVQRSPGGTPMKPKPKRRESNSDPVSVIAQALKKKFANQVLHSPDVDKENDSFVFSSPDTNSPHCIRPGSKRIRKRSIFSEDKKRLSGSIRL